MPSEPVAVKCPLCHAGLVVTKRGWRCARWAPKLGRCNFSIVRNWQGTRLHEDDLQTLVTTGRLFWPTRTGAPGWFAVNSGDPTCGCTWRPGSEPPEPVGMRCRPPSGPQAKPQSLFATPATERSD